MLSARYLHLHEALGLGPMWLKQAAAVLPPKNTPAPSAQARPQTVRAAPIRPSQPHNGQARLETMKALETAAVPTRKPAPETETPLPGLSDGIAPVPAASGITKLAVVSLCPPIEDAVYGQLFHGKAGILLDNILKAVGLDAAYVHKTCWVKTAAVGNPMPSEQAVANALGQLDGCRAPAVLFLGQAFVQPERQTMIETLCGSRPFFIIDHPARLLRQPELKARAWQVLKQLKRALRQGGGS
ncbi:uracil-DNA glycosylase family protein [Neisseria meningitidis]|uniref:uracil-DNA glycosylase family protein n=1 Tax=Neisseria meningitidis TaxID=487 RepID=UPI000F53FBA1|nr:uracil-DNA glycosylase family protein [Neisseria meningitidis]RQK19304.1 uracil-DNA glycosylase family protein [Neisseria meningitidis]